MNTISHTKNHTPLMRTLGTIGVLIGLIAGILHIWQISIPENILPILKTLGITFGCSVGIIAIWMHK